MTRARLRRLLAVAPLVGLVSVASPAASTPRPPTVALLRATIDRKARTVDVRLRVCFSAGPRAEIVVNERRALGGVVEAARRWAPRGVEPIRIYPFSCRSGWRLNWLLERQLAGPGTYTATIRVRDAYGRWARPVGFSVTSP